MAAAVSFLADEALWLGIPGFGCSALFWLRGGGLAGGAMGCTVRASASHGLTVIWTENDSNDSKTTA